MTTENMPKKGSNKVWYIAAVIIVVIIVVVGVLAYQMSQPSSNPTPSPTQAPSTSPSGSGSAVSKTIYAGEKSASVYGFGNSASTIDSPGPALTFKVGDVVTLTLVNSSPNMPHNWAMVSDKSTVSSVVFNAQIQSGSNPISPGASKSVTFTITQAGNYYYICQVPGHVALGMWGTVTVNP